MTTKDRFATPKAVCELIADTPCREGVPTGRVRSANPAHPESGRKRLREIAVRFRDLTGRTPYYYDHNRFYPTGPFRAYCRREAKKYELN